MFDARTIAKWCVNCRVTQKLLKKRQYAAAEDPEKKRARRQRYKERHPGRVSEQARCYRATPERREYMSNTHDRDRFGGLRHLVLERDGYVCTSCGVGQQEGKRNIIIHHKDHNPQNNTMDNLITLCRKCHPHRHEPTPELIEKRVAPLRGRKRGPGKPWSPERRARMRKVNTGRVHSAAVRQRMSEGKRRWWAERKAQLAASLVETGHQDQPGP